MFAYYDNIIVGCCYSENCLSRRPNHESHLSQWSLTNLIGYEFTGVSLQSAKQQLTFCPPCTCMSTYLHLLPQFCEGSSKFAVTVTISMICQTTSATATNTFALGLLPSPIHDQTCETYPAWSICGTSCTPIYTNRGGQNFFSLANSLFLYPPPIMEFVLSWRRPCISKCM